MNMNESFKEKLGMLLGFTIAACVLGLFGIAMFAVLHYGLQFFGLSFPDQYAHLSLITKNTAFASPGAFIAGAAGYVAGAFTFYKKVKPFDLQDPSLSTSMKVKIVGLSVGILMALISLQALCISHLPVLNLNPTSETSLRLLLQFATGASFGYMGHVMHKIRNLLTRRS